MPKPERLALIKKIEEIRGSRLITYVTSTRQNLEVPMAMDSIRKIYDHLKPISTAKRESKIDLFLYSNGGDGTVPWRLVTLIREFASKFSVLVPYRAFSAATLTALGANEVVMHRMGMLGPTDPTVQNIFNPPDPNQPGKLAGISVEDVTAYIALIKEEAGIHHEDELVQAFKILAEKVHPLALGNVKRSLSQSRMMAKKLLALHMKKAEDEHSIDEIVDSLTSKLFYHGHPINRREAREQVGLKMVTDASTVLEELIWDLYLDYESEMDLETPFNVASEFLAAHPQILTEPVTLPISNAKLVFIESTDHTDVFNFEYELIGYPNQGGGIQVGTLGRHQRWLQI